MHHPGRRAGPCLVGHHAGGRVLGPAGRARAGRAPLGRRDDRWAEPTSAPAAVVVVVVAVVAVVVVVVVAVDGVAEYFEVFVATASLPAERTLRLELTDVDLVVERHLPETGAVTTGGGTASDLLLELWRRHDPLIFHTGGRPGGAHGLADDLTSASCPQPHAVFPRATSNSARIECMFDWMVEFDESAYPPDSAEPWPPPWPLEPLIPPDDLPVPPSLGAEDGVDLPALTPGNCRPSGWLALELDLGTTDPVRDG